MYWKWLEQYEQHLTVAYLRHNHAYATKYDANGHWTACACGTKTAVQPHKFNLKNILSCDCGYNHQALEVLVGMYNTDESEFEWRPVYGIPHDEIEAKIAVLSGQQTADATVNVRYYNENEVPADDAEKIRNYANANFSGKSYGVEWMDISLIGEDGNPIRELDSPLAFGFDTAGRNILGIASVHDGKLIRFERFDDKYDIFVPGAKDIISATKNSILVESAQAMLAQANTVPMGVLSMDFSTYAIIYEVEQTTDNPDVPQTPADSDNPDVPQTPTDSEKPYDSQTPSSPQTSDNTNMALWFALLLLSGGAIITLTVYDIKRRITANR